MDRRALHPAVSVAAFHELGGLACRIATVDETEARDVPTDLGPLDGQLNQAENRTEKGKLKGEHSR